MTTTEAINVAAGFLALATLAVTRIRRLARDFNVATRKAWDMYDTARQENDKRVDQMYHTAREIADSKLRDEKSIATLLENIGRLDRAVKTGKDRLMLYHTAVGEFFAAYESDRVKMLPTDGKEIRLVDEAGLLCTKFYELREFRKAFPLTDKKPAV